MKRKFLAVMLAIAIIVAYVPTLRLVVSAEDPYDNRVFVVDFTKGTDEELTGNATGPRVLETDGEPEGTLEYVMDDELGVTVAEIKGRSLQYQMPEEIYSAMSTEFAIETLVKVKKDARWGKICGHYWEQPVPSGSGIFVGRNGQGTPRGFNRGFSVIEGYDGEPHTLEGSRDIAYDQWVHVVYVHTNGKAQLYLNGELWDEMDSVDTLLMRQDEGGNYSGFMIGGYNYANNWPVTEMRMAYCRVFSKTETAEDVKEMYEKRLQEMPSPKPTPVPTPSPVPGSMEELKSKIEFDMDFSKVDDIINLPSTDLTGKYTFDGINDQDTDNELVKDEDADRQVMQFDGYSYYKWHKTNGKSLVGTDLSKTGITLEAYVYLDEMPDDATFDYSPVVVESAGTALHFQEYNIAHPKGDDKQEIASGFRCGAYADGDIVDMSTANAYAVNERWPKGEWIHLVGVSDGYTNKYYLNGELKVTLDRGTDPDTGEPCTTLRAAASQTNDAMVTIGGSKMGNQFVETLMNGKVAFARIYLSDATDENVKELYELAVNNGATPTPTASPTPSPTPVPDPTPEVPMGGDFETAAEKVLPFKAGDSVKIKISVPKINAEKLTGVDLVVAYDNSKLEPVNLDNISVRNWNASKGKLDEAGLTDWDFSGRVEADDSLIYMYFTDENTVGMNDSDKIWVEMEFTAVGDGNVNDTIAWTTTVTGADGALNIIEGKGVVVQIAEPDPTPSPEPTEVPTEAPTEEPTQAPTEAPTDEPTEAPDEPTEAPDEPTEAPDEPTEAPDEPTEAPNEPTEAPAGPTQAPATPTQKPAAPTAKPSDPDRPVNPSTFDIGLIPLTGVVLAALTVIKRRKED